MPQTSNSASSAYIDSANFLLCYSQSVVADMLRANPNSPPPSYLAILDPSNPAGVKLLKHLKIGAGEIESACAVAKRYVPLDLQNLTGVSNELLQKLNAARAMWSLAHTLKPITARPKDVPYADESAELLQMLRDGDRIFSFVESQDAGLPSVQPPNQAALVTPNPLGRVAPRLFPGTSFALNQGGGN